MKAIAVVLLLSVVAGAWTAEDETFSSDFTTAEGVAREVQSVAVATNPELAVPAATVAHLPAHDEEEGDAAAENDEEADEEVSEESFAELSASAPNSAEAKALAEAAAALKAATASAPAAAAAAAEPAGPVSPQVAEIVKKVAAIVTLIPKVPGVEAAAASAAAAAAAAGKPAAPPAGAVAAAGKPAAAAAGPGAIPSAATTAAAVGAAPPAPPVPAVAPPPPKPAPRPLNPLVKKRAPANPSAMPPMAGPPVQDVSAKKLRQAQIARSKAELRNRQLRNKLKRLRKRLQRRIRMEREKCAGKCDRKFPITVGPHHIPSTETRRVIVEGDRARNKKRWQAVATHKRLMWLPKKLKKVYKFHDRVGKRIRKHHNFIKKTRAAPLVERRGKFIVKNWKDYDVMKEFAPNSKYGPKA